MLIGQHDVYEIKFKKLTSTRGGAGGCQAKVDNEAGGGVKNSPKKYDVICERSLTGNRFNSVWSF